MLVIASAILPCVSIQLIAMTAQYAPIFISHLDESNSRLAITMASQIQSQFENLVFAVPVGAFLAWAVRSTPLKTSLLVVAGYSIAWLVWGFFEDIPPKESLGSLLVYYHLPIPLLLGLSVFCFSKIFRRRVHVVA